MRCWYQLFHGVRLLRTLIFTLLALLAGKSHLEGSDVRYRVRDLYLDHAEVVRGGASAINAQGDVTGAVFMRGDDFAKPFLYRNGSGLAVLDQLNGFGLGINSNQQVAVFGFVPGTSGGTNAWRWTPGVGYEPLGTLAGDGEIGDVAIGINNLGHVVGRSDVQERPWQVAFLYKDETGMFSLGSLSSNQAAVANAINDRGQITGSTSGGFVFLYTAETGMVPLAQGQGDAINNRGVVAGRVGTPYITGYEAAIFENGTTRRLGTLDGETWALGINDSNVVVGHTYPVRSGFVWSEAEGIQRLDTLVEPGWFIYGVWAINNNGQIAGEANGKAVRFDPIPPRMAIARNGTNVVVSWSPAWPGIALEAANDFTAPDWQPLETGGTNTVSLALTNCSRFFRLNLDGIRGLCCVPEDMEK